MRRPERTLRRRSVVRAVVGWDRCSPADTMLQRNSHVGLGDGRNVGSADDDSGAATARTDRDQMGAPYGYAPSISRGVALAPPPPAAPGCGGSRWQGKFGRRALPWRSGLLWGVRTFELARAGFYLLLLT